MSVRTTITATTETTATVLYFCGSIVCFRSWIFLIIADGHDDAEDDDDDDSAGVKEMCL